MRICNGLDQVKIQSLNYEICFETIATIKVIVLKKEKILFE